MIGSRRLGFRNFEKDADRMDTELKASSDFAAGGLENKIHLIPSGTGSITSYSKDATGLAAAITASASGDKILIVNGTISGNHTNKSGVEIIGWGENTVLSGTITNNGTISNLKLTGSFTNNSTFNNVYLPTSSVVISGDSNAINGGVDFSAILSGSSNVIDTATTGVSVICGGSLVEVYGNFAGVLSGQSIVISADADYSAVVGGRQHTISDVAGASAFRNIIGGGDGHTLQDTRDAGILSGSACRIWATGGNVVLRSVIGGGDGLDIKNSDDCGIFSGRGSTIDNTSHWSVIAGGQDIDIGPTAQAQWAAAGGGRLNIIDGEDYCTIPGGYQAKADKFGQVAHAAGAFATVGDNQDGRFNLRRAVTHSDANWYALWLDGASLRLTIPADTLYTFTAKISGITQGATKSFSFIIHGSIENDGGATTLKGSATAYSENGDDASFSARVTADDTNDALLVEVSDSDGAGDVVRWGALVELEQVTFPA